MRLLFWGFLFWAGPKACGWHFIHYLRFLDEQFSNTKAFNPSFLLKSCKHKLLPSQSFFDLNLANRTRWLISQDIKLSIPDTQNYLLDLESWRCTSRICEVWCKSSHHYPNALKKASHRLNKSFFLHLWHYSMSMNRSLSSLHGSSPLYPLWQESSSALFLPFSTVPPPHPPTTPLALSFLSTAITFCKWLHQKSTGEEPCSHSWTIRTRLKSTLLLSLQAQCPRGYKAQSYSLPTWIKYAHCQHFLQQPGTLFIFARHRAE